jgi:hypothetical protein
MRILPSAEEELMQASSDMILQKKFDRGFSRIRGSDTSQFGGVVRSKKFQFRIESIVLTHCDSCGREEAIFETTYCLALTICARK